MQLLLAIKPHENSNTRTVSKRRHESTRWMHDYSCPEIKRKHKKHSWISQLPNIFITICMIIDKSI